MSTTYLDDGDEFHEEDDDELLEPGATTMWFGKHEGARLDELDDNYRWLLVRYAREKPWAANLAEFKILHDKYMDWMDQRQSPMSTKVWFGKYKGHELRILWTRPRRWTWLMRNCDFWSPELKSIEQRYRAWELAHPRRHRARASRVVLNRVGMRLGPGDDRPASDNDEDYDSDGGFVVADDEVEQEMEEDSSGWEEESQTEFEDEQVDEDVEVADDPTVRAVAHPEAEDSDASLPSISEVFRAAVAKKAQREAERASKPPSQGRSRPHANSVASKSSSNLFCSQGSSGDDTDDQPLFSPDKQTRANRHRKSVVVDSDHELGSPSKGGAKSAGGGRARASQGAKTIIVISSDSDTDDEVDEPQGRVSQVDVKESIESDDEPLVPKILAEKWRRISV